MKKYFFLLFLAVSSVLDLNGQDLLDDLPQIKTNLEKEITQQRKSLDDRKSDPAKVMNRLLDLGDWTYVNTKLPTIKNLSRVDKIDVQAKYNWLNNEFKAVDELLSELDKKESSHLKIQKWKAILLIEAWQLEEAEELMKAILPQTSNDHDYSMVLGRALMLQKKYPEALQLANDLIKHFPDQAAGYFLKADVFFWDQKPKEAEEVLVKGLKLDPFHADARFYYGYAIWRRIDATQLDAMVGQWEIALKLNPLHFQSHWHLGNGHTNLTYADYLDTQEKEIRKDLSQADSLFTANKINDSYQVIDQITAKFPNSVLPAMHKASLLYSDFDALDRLERLRKSENLFIEILQKKKHYGPAHNGLAAVIKSKRIPYLKTYDRIMQSLRNPKIDNMEDFLEVFPDVAYYPGNVAKGMAWNQLYTSTVYFPFLVKQHRLFVIPPLHIDLAIAMKAPYFRFNTTFDNRQWMDIRGVGSGAAAIEYVERGAFEERNVLLHEYVHLFHGTVLTDEQNRKIKSLYYSAMENGKTLDYYSQNNESEYFAQTYPAYFEKVKVHPLDFKSMNTLSDLQTKDPEMYAFLDQLIKKEKAYLAGDHKAMASNWSQVYLNLANYNSRNDLDEAIRLIDTALQYDAAYLPAILANAEFLISQRKYEEANQKLNQAKALDADYAPIYLSEAHLLGTKDPENVDGQARLYQKAYELETDYMEQARISATLRNFYFYRGRLVEALQTADEYMQKGSEISTYLRDRKDETKTFAAWQRALLGDKEQLKTLAHISAQKPQNYGIRMQYLEALLANQEADKALENLDKIYPTLQATQTGRADFELLYAEAYAQKGDLKSLSDFLAKLMVRDGDPSRTSPENNLKITKLLIAQDKIAEAEVFFSKMEGEHSSIFYASEELTKALFSMKKGDKEAALLQIQKALDFYPYQMDALKTLKEWSTKIPNAKIILDNHLKTMEILPKL